MVESATPMAKRLVRRIEYGAQLRGSITEKDLEQLDRYKQKFCYLTSDFDAGNNHLE